MKTLKETLLDRDYEVDLSFYTIFQNIQLKYYACINDDELCFAGRWDLEKNPWDIIPGKKISYTKAVALLDCEKSVVMVTKDDNAFFLAYSSEFDAYLFARLWTIESVGFRKDSFRNKNLDNLFIDIGMGGMLDLDDWIKGAHGIPPKSRVKECYAFDNEEIVKLVKYIANQAQDQEPLKRSIIQYCDSIKS